MQYFVSSADEELAARVRDELQEAGVAVTGEYHDDAVVVSLGGDGSILYNARTYGDPIVLPVATDGSAAYRIQVQREELLEGVRRLERSVEGQGYRVVSHRKLVATVDGEAPGDGVAAMNDVHLHHPSPVRAAKFSVEIFDGDERVYAAEKAIGDGVLVATPFGSTAYFRSIAGGSFRQGVGVAFNNLHAPVDAPDFLVLSPDARVVVETLPVSHADDAVLVRDDDPDPYPLEPGRPAEIALSDRTVDVIRFPE